MSQNRPPCARLTRQRGGITVSVRAAGAVIGLDPSTRQQAAHAAAGARASPDISPSPAKVRTALPKKCPIIEVSKLDESVGNAETKLYTANRA